MSKDTVILTTKDFTILEAMCDNPLARRDLLVPQIRRKLDAAIVVFRQDLPEGVASINSRVTFRVESSLREGVARDTRILSTGQVDGPVGMFLPVTTPRGLALLGLGEGQQAVLENAGGGEERIVLEKVEYQPEEAWRARIRDRDRDLERVGNDTPPANGRPQLRVVPGGLVPRRGPVPATPRGRDDDPGPSAA